jgi:hypothetical protein
MAADVTQRADFHKFPAYLGGNTHFPMLIRTIAANRAT